MKERRHYDREFKQMAVELSKARDNVPEVAKELGIRSEILSRWRREAARYAEGSFPGKGNPAQTDSEKEIARLKKKLHDAELERDILKKAVGIFSKNDGKFTGL